MDKSAKQILQNRYSDYQKSLLKRTLNHFTALFRFANLTDVHIKHLAETLKTNVTITDVDQFK